MGLNYSGTKSSNLSCTRDTIHHFADFGTNFFYATFLSESFGKCFKIMSVEYKNQL